MPPRKVMKAVANKGDPNPPATSRTVKERGWSELPEELLRMIFYKFDNLRAINPCRRVNHYWKSIAESVLEQRAVAIWKSWDPSESAFKRFQTLHTFPTLKLVSFDIDSEFERAYYPVAFNKFVGKSNPFPTRSLCIKEFGPLECVPLTRLNKNKGAYHKQRKNFELLKFLKSYGHHLTYLHLYNVEASPQELFSALETTPNLQALTLSSVIIDQEDDHNRTLMKKKNSSPCMKLTHLRMWNTDYKLQQWFLKLFEAHITTLEFDGNVVSFDSKEKEAVCYIPFRNLERLKAVSPSWAFIRNASPLIPIKYMSLIDPTEHSSLEQVMGFIDKFLGTLIELHLNFNMHYFLERDIPMKRDFVLFPKLKKFAISDVCQNLLIRYFLLRFTKLEILQILNHSEWRWVRDNLDKETVKEQIAQSFLDEKYWDISLMLKAIEVHKDFLDSEKPTDFLTIKRKPNQLNLNVVGTDDA